MDREPGWSVRAKPALSYAGFLMLAGSVILGAVWIFLIRVPHVGLVFEPRYQLAVVRAFAPFAVITLSGLLLVGLVGGWLLAGRMLAPLTRITAATRTAATGSLSHRIDLEGRDDEFRRAGRPASTRCWRGSRPTSWDNGSSP